MLKASANSSAVLLNLNLTLLQLIFVTKLANMTIIGNLFSQLV